MLQKIAEGHTIVADGEVYVFGPSSARAYNVIAGLVQRGLDAEKVGITIDLCSADGNSGRAFLFQELVKLLADS